MTHACNCAPDESFERTGDPVVALAGNPNTGKSSVFNFLTGSSQHVGNWPGKTVARAEGTCTHGGVTLNIVDLPGTYSLNASSPEEQIARDFLISGEADAVVIIVDASNLERNLYLAVQVLEMDMPAVIALNMVDVAETRGIEIDADELSHRLGVPVIATVARKRQGLDELSHQLVHMTTAGAA